VIGAWAFPAYGYSRSTYDIDVFFNPIKEKVKRLAKALKDVGYSGLEDLTTEDVLNKNIISSICFGYRHSSFCCGYRV
jgi:regulatory protein YycH of two-component signal transduction system YycFG